MKKSLLVLFSLLVLQTAFSGAQTQKPSEESQLTAEAVKSVLKIVADYQVRTPLTHTGANWTNGALYVGMAEWARIAGDDRYYNWLKEMGDKNN